jgi:hypothetical protein
VQGDASGGTNNLQAKQKLLAQWGRAIATAEIVSHIGVKGTLLMDVRFLTALKYANELGKVIKVELPMAPPSGDVEKDAKVRNVYGMLTAVTIRVTLKNDSIRAEGEMLLEATRGEAEQKVFAVSSDIFKDEQDK